MPAYVIKSWNINEHPDAEGRYVHIVGRAPGLMAWLLSMIGIDPLVELSVTEDKITYTEGSLAGSTVRTVPLRAVCSTVHGYSRPVREALAWSIAGLAIVIGPLIGLLIYFLNQQVSILFVENSGVVSGISFKPSVLDGQKLDAARAAEATALIQRLVEKHR